MAKKKSTGKTTSSGPAAPTAAMRIVLLRGQDQYLKIAYTKHLADALVAEYGEIDEFAFDGNEAEVAVILDELRSYGLMQQHKLVIVNRADKLLAGGADDSGVKTPRKLLERYAENPVDSATLLLRAETWRPGNLDKAIAKVGGIIKCEAPTAGKAVAWCGARCTKEYGCTINPRAAEMLVELIGPTLARLDVELGKLAAAIGFDGSIELEHVRAMVGMSREDTAWSIQEAVISGRPEAAVGKLRELLDIAGHPKELVSWAVTDVLRKLHAASQMLRAGVPEQEVARRMKLWGDARFTVMRAARSIEPDRFAQLLHAAIAGDYGVKTGLGKAGRSLETLTVQIADTLGCAR